ncbi:MAG TPA: hypothetical protein VGE93_22755 [Bryobacteraceae bacterium]
MKTRDWRRSAIESLIVGALIYLIMRFFVPHALDNDSRSLVGAVAAFVVAFIVLGISKTQKM